MSDQKKEKDVEKKLDNTEDEKNTFDFLETFFTFVSLLVIIFSLVWIISVNYHKKHEEIHLSAKIQIVDYSVKENVDSLLENKEAGLALKISFTNDTKYSVTLSDIIGEDVSKNDEGKYIVSQKYRVEFENRDDSSTDVSSSIISIAPGQAYDGYIYYPIKLDNNDVQEIINQSQAENIYRILLQRIQNEFADETISFDSGNYNRLFRIRYKYSNTISSEKKEKQYVIGFTYASLEMGNLVTRESINGGFSTDVYADVKNDFEIATNDSWNDQDDSIPEPSPEDKVAVIKLIKEKYGYDINTTEELDKIAYLVADECEEYTGHQITCIAWGAGKDIEGAVDSLMIEYDEEGSFVNFQKSSYWGLAVVPSPYYSDQYSIAVISSEQE